MPLDVFLELFLNNAVFKLENSFLPWLANLCVAFLEDQVICDPLNNCFWAESYFINIKNMFWPTRLLDDNLRIFEYTPSHRSCRLNPNRVSYMVMEVCWETVTIYLLSFVKLTDRNLLLHFSSYHSPPLCNDLSYRPYLRLRRNSSYKWNNLLKTRTETTWSW